MLYIGDLRQQLFIGTICNWADAEEEFSSDDQVVLEKVYRNTRSILLYLQKLGFSTVVPDELSEGAPVNDLACSEDEEYKQVLTYTKANNDTKQIGILSPSSAYLDRFLSELHDQANVHLLSIHEAQGVEFDTVFLVGVPNDFMMDDPSLDSKFNQERQHIKKDLLYVGLTRAMDELFILGRKRLQDILNN